MSEDKKDLKGIERRRADMNLAAGMAWMERAQALEQQLAVEAQRAALWMSTAEEQRRRAEAAEKQLAEARAERDQSLHHLGVEMAKNSTSAEASAGVAHRSCNRHSDCTKAEQEVLARNPGKKLTDIALGFHCHDDECEDCFGS